MAREAPRQPSTSGMSNPAMRSNSNAGLRGSGIVSNATLATAAISQSLSTTLEMRWSLPALSSLVKNSRRSLYGMHLPREAEFTWESLLTRRFELADGDQRALVEVAREHLHAAHGERNE